jgi:5-enolpyruvylshikimate-3-phosphate synthase
LAMAAAMLAFTATGESRIADVACVRTSYPEFVADAVRLGHIPDPRHRSVRTARLRPD